MLKAWFKGCLVGILALKGCLSCFKQLKFLFVARLCELCVICPKKCLGIIWIKKIDSD